MIYIFGSYIVLWLRLVLLFFPELRFPRFDQLLNYHPVYWVSIKLMQSFLTILKVASLMRMADFMIFVARIPWSKSSFSSQLQASSFIENFLSSHNFVQDFYLHDTNAFKFDILILLLIVRYKILTNKGE